MFYLNSIQNLDLTCRNDSLKHIYQCFYKNYRLKNDFGPADKVLTDATKRTYDSI